MKRVKRQPRLSLEPQNRRGAALFAAALLFLIGTAIAGELSTVRVSLDNESTEWIGGGRECVMSGNARLVAFISTTQEAPVSASRPAQLFLRDRDADTDGVNDETGEPGAVATRLLSINSTNEPANAPCSQPSMSADGRFVAFASSADNLLPDDANELADVYVVNLATGALTRISVPDTAGAPESNGISELPSISADGRFVAFQSRATNLGAVDLNNVSDIYLRDRDSDTDGIFDEADAGRTILVSRTPALLAGNGISAQPAISGNGRYIAYLSLATNLVANDLTVKNDVFVFDRVAGTNTIVSRASNNGVQGDDSFFTSINANPALSYTGRYVAFQSRASNLVPNDVGDLADVFLVDRGAPDTGGAFANASLTTERVSISSSGVAGDRNSGTDRISICSSPLPSRDGRWVAFNSFARNLVPGDVENLSDIYVRDRQNGTTALYSVSLAFTPGDRASGYPQISEDGNSVVFDSESTNLVSSDTNEATDVFVRRQPSCLGPASDPPVALIITDLADVTACDGDVVQLGIVPNLNATAPFFFRFQRDGIDLPNMPTTQPTLSLGPLTLADGGANRYRVIVENACGSQISRLATLTVRERARITQQPTGTTACLGTALNLTVIAAGAAPLNFQWSKDNNPIPNATGATYTVPAPTTQDSGVYSCVVTNICGSVASNAANVVVSDEPVITSQPVSELDVCVGRPFSITVGVAPVPPATYQWLRNGNNIPGSTAATFSKNAAVAGDVGDYTCQVKSTCGTVVSRRCSVSVLANAAITSQPANQTGCVGGTARFSIGATPSTGLTYRWRRGTTNLVNGPSIAGVDTAMLTLSSLSAASAASNYNCVVTGNCGSVTSNSVGLRVDEPPSIVTQPANRTAAVGTSVTFSISARGGTPLSYQWRKGTTNINGATGTTLTINPVANASAGQYSCQVTNACGMIVTNSATLTVTGATTQPTTQPSTQPTTQPGGDPGPDPVPCGLCGAGATQATLVSYLLLLYSRRRRRAPRSR